MGVAASFDTLPAPCAVSGCPEDPRARTIFGCDGDADPGYLVWCWTCRGSPAGCPTCENGSVSVNRCPSRCMTPEVGAMFRAYSHYKAGFLPIAGGMLDQSATFCDAVSLIASVVSHHEEVQMERSRD